MGKKEEKRVSYLACGVGMPRVKRLHHHRPLHGTHVPVAGAPGKVPGWGNSKFERAKGTDCSR